MGCAELVMLPHTPHGAAVLVSSHVTSAWDEIRDPNDNPRSLLQPAKCD